MQPKITPLCTGHVAITQAMRVGVGTGARRRLAMLRDDKWTEPLPIYAWLIEHDDGLLLVDTGEVAAARDQPFARFQLTREQELDYALAAVQIAPADVQTVVLTHLHADHMDGVTHLPNATVLVSDTELSSAHRLGTRLTRTVLRQPLPDPFAPTAITLDGPPRGAFSRSCPLSADGRIVAVPAPGHTDGQIAILVECDSDHVLLCGDAGYDLKQIVELVPDGAGPDPKQARKTMQTILEHASRYPTVVLPSHDPDGAERLATRTTLS